VRYTHRDRLGSVVAVTDEAGAPIERLSYDVWGKRRNGDGSTHHAAQPALAEHRDGYTGHEMLDAIGLVHMNGRVYDPTLARFLSADPTVPDAADTQNYNRYSYVLNNPTVYTDPSGFAQVRQVELTTGLGGPGGPMSLFGTSMWPLMLAGLDSIPTFDDLGGEGLASKDRPKPRFDYRSICNHNFNCTIYINPQGEEAKARGWFGPTAARIDNAIAGVMLASNGATSSLSLAEIFGSRESVVKCDERCQEVMRELWSAAVGFLPLSGLPDALESWESGHHWTAAFQFATELPWLKQVKNVVNISRAVGKAAKGARPNGGIAPRHGGTAHNDAIDQRVRELRSDPSVSSIRKNQQQVDASGNKVGTNRPDLQYDQGGCHRCVEFDTVPRNSTRHGDVIRANDPKTKIELIQL
jgi:RHS repeat-associated protein